MEFWKKIIEFLTKSANDSEEWAIQYLIKNIPWSTWYDIKKNPSKYLNDEFFGRYLRNLLRQGGFSWGGSAPDEKLNDLVRKSLSDLPDDFFLGSYCNYCGKIIEGMPFENQRGQKFCADHKVPETRGERGSNYLSKEYRTIEHSNGKTEYKK
jgi:hypothetical protein